VRKGKDAIMGKTGKMRPGRNQGGHCGCEGCGQQFTGMQPFDMHRVGSYASGRKPSTRRCLSADEMHAKGMTQTESGAWATGRPYGTGKRIA
jgi:hypothetical protein